MTQDSSDPWLKLDSLIEDQLALQVEISFAEHHEFLRAHGLGQCKTVADLGCGNGMFLKRLAIENPHVNFVGLDKREQLLARARDGASANTSWINTDLTSEALPSALSSTDGILMRYFLLHIPHAKEALQTWLKSVKSGTHFWIIDVDLATFACDPPSREFDALKEVTQKFCDVNSIDTLAGQKLGVLLSELGFSEISSKSSPFSSRKIAPAEFTRFLRNELNLYASLLDPQPSAAHLSSIEQFLQREVFSGRTHIDYGMILWHAVWP